MTTNNNTQAASVKDGREKEMMLGKLATFINQRPGLELGNYGDLSSYRSELRTITKARHQAHELLGLVARSGSIDAEQIKQAARSAYSGRLSWENGEWDYCTGQYFPTEYRNAACAVLSQALWNWFREKCNCETREKIQAAARRELSRSVATRWFK